MLHKAPHFIELTYTQWKHETLYAARASETTRTRLQIYVGQHFLKENILATSRNMAEESTRVLCETVLTIAWIKNGSSDFILSGQL